MKILLIIFCVVVVVTLIAEFIIVPWSAHKNMTKSFSQKHGKINFKRFVEEFNKNKYNWKYDPNHKTSLFDYNTNSEIHASIIKFNDIGMIMRTPWDYWMTKFYIKKYIKENFDTNQNYNWKDKNNA